jgi:hypothetical protein
VPFVAQQAVRILVARLVDPTMRDSGEEDLDFVSFGDLCYDFAGAWVASWFEGEEVDCAVFWRCRCVVWTTCWCG